MNHREIMEALLAGKKLADGENYIHLNGDSLMTGSDMTGNDLDDEAWTVKTLCFEYHKTLYTPTAAPSKHIVGTWPWAWDQLKAGKGLRRPAFLSTENIILTKKGLRMNVQDKLALEHYAAAEEDFDSNEWTIV